jgi:hypothetical protein
MPVRLGVWRAAALPAALAASIVLTLVAGAAAQSPSPPQPAAAPPQPAAAPPQPAAAPPQPAAALPQPKPVTGFVPTFEIMRTVRAAGFDPLAPPLREGTTYVLRATDYRGILMRVVLDARTGTIRDVTRIVPAASGSLGVVLPPYGPPRYASPYVDAPYGAPVEYEVPPAALQPLEEGAAPQLSPPIAAPPVTHAKALLRKLPLPRPRPAGLAASQGSAAEKGAPASDQGPAAASEKEKTEKTIGNANPIIAQPAPAPPAAQIKAAAPVPLND